MEKQYALVKVILTYTLGLVLILALIFLSFAVRSDANEKFERATVLISFVRKERSLIQRISSLVAQSRLGNSNALMLAKKDFIHFKQYHKSLRAYAEKQDFGSDVIFNQNNSIALQITRFSQLSDQLFGISPKEKRFVVLSNQLFEIANGDLFMELNASIDSIQERLNHQLNNIDRLLASIRIMFLIIFILITAITFRYIFQQKKLLEKKMIALREADKKFELMVNTVKGYAIFLLDPNGNIKTWNKAAESIKGYTADEIFGKHFSIFYMDEDKKNNHPQKELQLAIKNGFYEEEGWRIGKGNKAFWADVVITPLYNNHDLIGFAKVTRDLTEKRTLETMKNDFVSIVSHELRTPLTAILGAISLLISLTTQSEERVKELLKITQKNSQRLLQLINDLLDYEKISANRMTLTIERCDIEKVIMESIEVNKPIADKYHISIVIAEEIHNCFVNVDHNRFIQVLTNLLSNALKFQVENKPVVISVKKNKNHIVVSVINNGPMIPLEFQKRIFQRFMQADMPYIKEKGGVGLGLAISKMLIEQMHGVIGFRSSIYETVFYIELPLETDN